MPNKNYYGYIQQSVLSKLLCYLCRKYLSVYPIYTHPTRGSICGRCSPKYIDENFTQNNIYEAAAAFQKFPCCNESRGCLKLLFPSQATQHERLCSFRIVKCPTRVYHNCAWEGSSSDILEHFESNHPTFILKECRFEVDFINNHDESYVFAYADQVYLLERGTKDKTFSVKVDYLGHVSKIDDMIYQVTMKTGNNSKEFCTTQDIGKIFQISSTKIKKALEDPLTVIAQVSILEKPNTNMIVLENKGKADGNQLDELECPVCMEYMVPPIYQCELGHSICGICKTSITECPQCRKGFTGTQNYLLERLVSTMTYPCKYEGCSYKSPPKDIKAHQSCCIFGPFECPLKEYEKCTKNFAFKDLYTHIKKNHYENLMELDTISIPYDTDLEQDIKDCYIIMHGSQLLKLCFFYDNNEKKFNWSVHLVGTTESNLVYKFAIDIIDKNKNNRLYIKRDCALGKDKPFENNDSFISLDYNLIKGFIRYQLSYRVHIFLEEVL